MSRTHTIRWPVGARLSAVQRFGGRLVGDVLALPRLSLVLAAILLVLAAALAVPRGGPGALFMVLICVVIATVIAELFAEPADRSWVLLFVVLAVVGREALMGAIDAALLSRGNRWYAPDEHIYIEHAATIWQTW